MQLSETGGRESLLGLISDAKCYVEARNQIVLSRTKKVRFVINSISACGFPARDWIKVC